MLKNIKYIFLNLFIYSKLKTIIFLILSPFAALIQTLGILSIFPLITLLIDPEKILNNKYFINYYIFKYENNLDLTLQLGLIFFFINCFSIFIIISNNILIETLSSGFTNQLRLKFYKKILKPSSFLSVSKNRSEILNITLTHVENIKTSSSSLLFLIQSIFLIVGYLHIPLLINLKLLFFISIIILLFIFLFLFNRHLLKKLNAFQLHLAKKMSQITIYIQLGIKDLLILNLGKKFLQNLKQLQDKSLRLEMTKLFISLYPRYLMEIIIYSFALFYLYFSYENLILIEKINTFALIVLLVWRSIPVIFNFYRHVITINTYQKSFDDFFKYENLLQKNILPTLTIKNFTKDIKIKNLKFNYDKEKKFLFNCQIKKGDKVHLIGNSGSGKSTFLNLLTGLLTPKDGSLYIDNQKLDVNYKTSIFGYVTQDVFLFQGSLAENISLTKSQEKKKLLLKQLFNICGLQNITENFEDIFKKNIEINSPELSGGQKQRIAIARVLCLKPKILILDEATSALDKTSEKILLSNIFQAFPDLTIILVNHRDLKIKFDKKLKLVNNKHRKQFEINEK